jgi:hypothetical protein
MNTIQNLKRKKIMESQEKYIELDEEIQQQLKTINIKLKRHKEEHNKEPGNWSAVGDLNYIKSQLEEIVLFIK